MKTQKIAYRACFERLCAQRSPVKEFCEAGLGSRKSALKLPKIAHRSALLYNIP